MAMVKSWDIASRPFCPYPTHPKAPHPWILDRLYDDKESLYLLCTPDIPWIPDPFRENPHDRDQLFDIYHQELTGLGNPFVIITGLEHHKRLKVAIDAIQRFLV